MAECWGQRAMTGALAQGIRFMQVSFVFNPKHQVETLQEVVLALAERGSWQCGSCNHSGGVTKVRARVPWRLHQVC